MQAFSRGWSPSWLQNLHRGAPDLRGALAPGTPRVPAWFSLDELCMVLAFPWTSLLQVSGE